MDNFLSNGAILPTGLLSNNDAYMMAGFNKTYRNTQLRLGTVIQCYPVSDTRNLSKLSNEYDILVFEQNEDRGSSIVTYKNCLCSDSLGSIADFFEKSLRVKQNAPTVGSLIDIKNQNGALVLILCLDGMSDKAIIVGGMTHPDRQTNIVSSLPYLEGEYNGVNIKVANDGSATLTFNGTTDNYGNPTDPSQGVTTVEIQTDGSFQVQNPNATMLIAKSGDIKLTAIGGAELNLNQGTVALGASSIELLQQISDQLSKISDWIINNGATHIHTGNLGAPTTPPLNAGTWAQLGSDLSSIQQLVDTIKGEL